MGDMTEFDRNFKNTIREAQSAQALRPHPNTHVAVPPSVAQEKQAREMIDKLNRASIEIIEYAREQRSIDSSFAISGVIDEAIRRVEEEEDDTWIALVFSSDFRDILKDYLS